MANVPKVSVENNFTGGLKTEFTGLNFPENAATNTNNCIYTITGDVTRRPGFDYEDNYSQTTIDRTGCAISSYKWNNAGGDGVTQLVVEQIGSTIYFYSVSASTVASPLSTQQILTTVSLTPFIPSGSSNDPKGIECQYSDGNGYLFIYHPYCNPIYCIYSPVGGGSVSANLIDIKIRDFAGVPEPGVTITQRPIALTDEHNYNLQNQGWTNGVLWSATSTTNNVTLGSGTVTQAPGSYTYTVASGITGVSAGQAINFTTNVNVQSTTLVGIFLFPITVNYSLTLTGTGTVNSYSGTSLSITWSTTVGASFEPGNSSNTITSVNTSIGTANSVNTITVWHTATGNYPSNTDIWFAFKNSSDVFDPATTLTHVIQPSAKAVGGHFILSAFDQQRDIVSTITAITDVTTYIRPKTGCWFQGRVWYTGIDSSVAASGDAPYTTWSESIYFSRIVTDVTDFGLCMQENDPTDQNLFDELPSDGGVISIQGAGSIYKLFPMKNGLLVFAGNGVWFITGSQGIGFTANDYTITRISAVQSISSTSFVDVQGLPVFWNEEGIYSVEPTQQGLSLNVNPLTVGTILSFYANIPVQSKKYARGAYHPLDYTIKWIYRSTNESSVTDRYEYDSIMNLNTYNKAFFPYSISGTPHIHSITYVAGPGGSTSPDPVFKYLTSVPSSGSYKFTFSEENNLDYLDWFSQDNVGVDYSSYFVTGYKLHGQALRQWQPEYVYIYSTVPSYYKIQGIWNYAKSGNSGKYSSIQNITNDSVTYENFGIVMRRHRIRGHGIVLQLKVLSVRGQPFDINGWAIWEQTNAGI